MIHTAEQARIEAGLTIAEAAKLAGRHKRGGYSPRYIRQIEVSGDCPYLTAQRLSRIYGCKMDVFLSKPGVKPMEGSQDVTLQAT